MKVTRRRKEELKLKESVRMDNAIPPIPMNHSCCLNRSTRYPVGALRKREPKRGIPTRKSLCSSVYPFCRKRFGAKVAKETKAALNHNHERPTHQMGDPISFKDFKMPGGFLFSISGEEGSLYKAEKKMDVINA